MVNDAWTAFARENGVADQTGVAVGANYLDVCRRAADANDGDAQVALAGLRSVLDGAAPHFVCEFPCHGPHQQRWFQMNATPLRGDGAAGAIVSHTDITARKLAEFDRLASETRFRALFDNAAVGMAEMAPDGRWLRVNATLLKTLAYAPGECLVGTMQDFTHPEDVDADTAHMEVLRAGAANSCMMEKRFMRRDGSAIWVAANLSCIRSPDGSVDYFIVVVEDISQRRTAEERQRTLMHELAHRGKNLLAVIQSLAQRSLAGDHSLDEAREAFSGRLRALATTYGALIAEAFDGALVHAVLNNELSAFGARAEIEGPNVILTVQAAQTFALVAHELATNAAKYGALSIPDGHLRAAWEVVETPEGPQFQFDWRERDGPPAKPPNRRGFGSTLLSRVAGLEFDCAPRLEYDEAGFHYGFEASLERLGALLAVSPVRRKLKGEIVCALYDAWARHRAPGGSLPQLASFDWSKFAATGALTIAKIESNGVVRFAEVGRALIGELGRALQDQDLQGEDPTSMAEVYKHCARKGEPCHEFLRFDFGDDEPLTFERLLVPFSATGGSVTHVVGVALYDGHTRPAGTYRG